MLELPGGVSLFIFVSSVAYDLFVCLSVRFGCLEKSFWGIYEFFARKILNCPAIFLRAPVFLFFSTFFLGYTFSRLYYLWDTTAVGRLYIERHHCIDISYISLVRLQFLYRFLVYLTSSLVSVDFFLRYGEIQYYGTSF